MKTTQTITAFVSADELRNTPDQGALSALMDCEFALYEPGMPLGQLAIVQCHVRVTIDEEGEKSLEIRGMFQQGHESHTWCHLRNSEVLALLSCVTSLAEENGRGAKLTLRDACSSAITSGQWKVQVGGWDRE